MLRGVAPAVCCSCRRAGRVESRGQHSHLLPLANATSASCRRMAPAGEQGLAASSPTPIATGTTGPGGGATAIGLGRGLGAGPRYVRSQGSDRSRIERRAGRSDRVEIEVDNPAATQPSNSGSSPCHAQLQQF